HVHAGKLRKLRPAQLRNPRIDAENPLKMVIVADDADAVAGHLRVELPHLRAEIAGARESFKRVFPYMAARPAMADDERIPQMRRPTEAFREAGKAGLAQRRSPFSANRKMSSLRTFHSTTSSNAISSRTRWMERSTLPFSSVMS